jgi:hypothetical protein
MTEEEEEGEDDPGSFAVLGQTLGICMVAILNLEIDRNAKMVMGEEAAQFWKEIGRSEEFKFDKFERLPGRHKAFLSSVLSPSLSNK